MSTPVSTALRLTGADALALLHRIGTNAVADLTPGQARATLFTDFRGRLLHRAVVAAAGDAIWLLRDDAPGAELAAFLDRHVFRDDVRIEDRSEALPVGRSDGPAGLATGTFEERDGAPAILQVGDGDALLALAAPEPRTADRERARIRAGRSSHGHEIAEAFTPFEVGLAHEVHLDKGCFTGQEALMRLITYKSVKRRLARLSGAGDAPAVPCDLADGGRTAGVLTSAVPDGGGWIGLAVLRNEVCDPPRALRLPDGRETATVEPLPLTRPLGRG
jgi:folate-binding protein YgfZ